MSPKNPDRIDAAVGQNIRIQRLAKGMSQSDLAAQLGVSFQQLQKYEKGSNRVGSSRLHRIAQAFGLPVTALYEGIGDPRRQRSAASSGLQLIADRQAFRLV